MTLRFWHRLHTDLSGRFGSGQVSAADPALDRVEGIRHVTNVAGRSGERESVGTAVVVVLMLLGVGIVIDQLFRLRNWLNKAPPTGEVREPDDENGADH